MEEKDDILKNLPKKKRRKPRNTRKRTGSFRDEDTSKKAAPKEDESTSSVKQSSVVAETTFASSRSAVPSGPENQGATIDLEDSAWEQARAESFKNRLKKRKLNVDEDGKAVDGPSTKDPTAVDDDAAPTAERYTGLKGYTKLKESRESSQGKYSRPGPVAPTEHIRVTNRFDYQPDLCKDYKETGYCGYGDSCKFLHDRGDYKMGWQIEREWDENQKRKKAAAMMGEEASDEEDYYVGSDDEDDVPFACYICREQFTDPVVTKCGHYFCEKCAFKRYRKKDRCAVCDKPTMGIFNVAEKIIKKMEKAAMQRSNISKSDLPDQKFAMSEGSWTYS